MPSISACGLASSVGMSLQAPGSDSSALTTGVRMVSAVMGPALFLGFAQARQAGVSRGVAAGRLAVGEAGQDPRRLLPGAQPRRAAGRRDVGARAQPVDQV